MFKLVESNSSHFSLSYFRHPSYAGFYYWALGTQLVLQNPLTFVLFTYLLWRFFYYRTRGKQFSTSFDHVLSLQ